jgi:hypothetical protein
MVHPASPKLAGEIMLADDAIRATHAISRAAYAALLHADREAFFRERAGAVQSAVRSFLRSRARWDDNDRPAISSLEVNDED